MEREAIIRNTDTYDNWHFAEATVVGRTIWVSGQRGVDERDQIPRDPMIQARVAFRHLERILRDAGANLDDIVCLTTYHTNMADLDGFRGIKDEFIRAPYPSWTFVGVSALATPEMAVEISAIAVVDSGRRPRERRLGGR
jgi:enamine deaminase RidA (YjgF/YER057c/UK114 family)